MRANTALVIEPAASWRRLQQSSEFFFEDLDAQMKEHHREFLEALMGYERQCFLNAQPYERTDQRVDQANGFYGRQLTTRLGVLDLRVPRTRSGCFRSQVLPRYQRREPVVNEALKQVFLLGVSTRQTGRALATLVEEAVSASTVSAVAKVLDATVGRWHRRPRTDHYRYLILDAVSVRIRLVGAVQRRMALCAYGLTREGKRELIDFQIVKAEAEDTWDGFLWSLWSRGLRGQFLELIVTRRSRRFGQGLGPVVARRSAPTLLGAQAAQPGEQTQSFAVSLSGPSQTHLSSPAPNRSITSLPGLEKALAERSPQSRGLLGTGLGRTAGLLRLSACALETGANDQRD